MKYFLIIVFCIFSNFATAEKLAVWGMRSEFWQESSEMERYIYVQGLFDSIAFSKYKMNGQKISLDLSIDQYVKAIDTLTADYKNSLIPVVFYLRIITLEVEGNNKETVEAELVKYRAYFSKK